MPDEPATPSTGRIKVALVTNIPAPYRVPVYNAIEASAAIDLKVFYAAAVEPDRRWDLQPMDHAHEILDGGMVTHKGRFIHHNPGLWKRLVAWSPDVVVTTGYNPTHLLAFVYAWLKRRAHVPQTDGTLESERALSWVHRVVRRIVIPRSAAAVVASQGGWRLLRHYGMPAEQIHFSPLCANTSVSWERAEGVERDVDFLFSARLVPHKRPDFALQVAQRVAQRVGRRLRIVLLGHGPMLSELRELAQGARADLDVEFAGHVSQAELPRWFHRAKLFLFPTEFDPWGIVANEACLAGVPVIVSPYAGVAGELVRDLHNGRVLPLDLDTWTEAAAAILADEALQALWSERSKQAVVPYSFANAAAGLVVAARQAAGADVGVRSISPFTPRES